MESWKNQRNNWITDTYIFEAKWQTVQFFGNNEGLGYNTNVRDVETLFHGVIDGFTVINALDKLIKEGKVISRVIQKLERQETYYKAF